MQTDLHRPLPLDPATQMLIAWASTSGHTEYVADRLVEWLGAKAPEARVRASAAEALQKPDLAQAKMLVLAASTWNTGAVEGQLNPHMSALLNHRARDLRLDDKPCACIGLGDHRYYYRARAADELERYVIDHGGQLVVRTLRIIDEPYGQEAAVTEWARDLLAAVIS